MEENKACTRSAGVTQLVECNLAKVDVAGSNPVSRSILLPAFLHQVRGWRLMPSFSLVTAMPKVDLYLKIELDLAADEKPDKVAQEICKQARKVYSVRSADVSSIVPRD